MCACACGANLFQKKNVMHCHTLILTLIHTRKPKHTLYSQEWSTIAKQGFEPGFEFRLSGAMLVDLQAAQVFQTER